MALQDDDGLYPSKQIYQSKTRRANDSDDKDDSTPGYPTDMT